MVSSPVVAGGYPGEAPAPGGCVAGPYDANKSESAIALWLGTEQLVGGAKPYFERWSTFKAQHTASFAFGPAAAVDAHRQRLRLREGGNAGDAAVGVIKEQAVTKSKELSRLVAIKR